MKNTQSTGRGKIKNRTCAGTTGKYKGNRAAENQKADPVRSCGKEQSRLATYA